MNFSGISNGSAIGALLRFPLRLLPTSTVMPILQGKLRGYRWITGSSNHGCWLGSYEFEKQNYVSNLVKPGSVIFDIGAHVGFYTLLFSVLAGDSGQVIAFEPFPANAKYLKQHIQMNKLNNVRMYEAAMAEKAGTADFETGISSSMGHITDQISPSTFQVKLVNIDELVNSGEVPPPDYIKLDIEGAELRALQGATETLKKHHPSIFLATHGHDIHKMCCNLLQELGYELLPISGSDITQTDELFAR